MKAHSDDGFPAHNTFARLGSKEQLAAKILDYCKARAGYADMIALCAPIAEQQQARQPQSDGSPVDTFAATKAGYVYLGLLKLGREKRYKIGKAVLVERRRDQISLQLPEDLDLVHAISTDDAYGIEEYWHKRFAAKNTKGEWFSLSRDAPPRDKVRGLKAYDIAEAMKAVTSALASGAITPGEAERITAVVDTFVRAIDASDFDRRLRELEDASKGARCDPHCRVWVAWLYNR
jgi:hypothetical protein